MSANFLAGALAVMFFVYITVRGELVKYAAILGIGDK